MPPRKGKRRVDSKESEEIQEEKPPIGKQETQSESKGACGTSSDERPDGIPKNNWRDRKGQWAKKRWEIKQDPSKPPYHVREQAGKDTTPNQGGARKKTGAFSQFWPSQGGRGRGTTVDRGNQQKNQGYRGRGRGASREHHVGLPKPSGSGRNQEQRPGARPYPKNRTQHPARQVPLDPKILKEMDTTEVVETLNESIPRLKFFLRSQEEEHKSDEFIFNLTCTLAIACNAPTSESTNKILAALKGSLFLSAKIPCLLDRVQASTAFSDPDSQRRLFQCLIKVFTRYLRQLPSSYTDLPYDQLKRALDQSNIERKDELQEELEDFKQARVDIIRAERLQRHGKRYINKAGQKPPNDFRNIPICPTNKEITTQERPFLRKNITKGEYEDAEHYLDVQFRLLREDFLEPLREGIHEIVQNVPRKQRNQLMRYYPGARVVDKTFTPSGIIYKVQFDVSRFDTRKWAHSKRLIFGSFLCLSKDNFETMLFATVANRDPEELKHGQIDIRFMKEQDVFGIENRKCEYQMVESPAYYEAYRHVLTGLKELDESTLPFKKYLVECSEDVDPPEYLIREDSQEPVCYDLSLALDVPYASNVPVLQPGAWPSVESLPLNNSQFEALKTAVTTEFSVIQGPPGTGKTYVGAKIVRCLLENRDAWDPEGISPMLMVCYTNHALDQFLEKVLEFLPQRKIIRVGGRCKSQQLEGCNLKLFTGRHRMHERRGEIRNRVEEKVREMTAWKELLWKADRVLLEFDDLEELLNSEHAEQLYTAIFPPNAETECRNPGNTFKLWLCSHKAMESFNRSSAKAERGNQTGKTYDGSSTQDGGEGGYDEVLYDVTLLTATQETNEGEESDSVRPESESGGVDLSEAYSPRETLSLSDTLSEVDASNPATKKDLIEAPLDTSLPKAQVSIEGLDEVENATAMTENSCEDTSEETITIEKEADLIQYQRFIHGDEDFLPVISKQVHDLESQKEDEDKTIEDLEDGWETVTYKKKGKAFPWQQKHEKNAKSEMESAPMSNVPNQESIAQTKSSKKKKKKKKKDKKIKITADIKSLKPDLEKETMMTTDEAMCVDNIWLLSSSDRLRLYLFWVESYRERFRVEICRGEQEYEDLCLELETVRFEEEEEVIRRATVVGMTTSGAARYHSVLQRVAPRVVVIEEAAEVMEAHIVTSLAKDTKHTILIGDHKQLRPKATVYELAQKYNLEISLFERMVMNKMDCKRLCIQHRMRPEIALLTKRIYDHEIVDHESVCEFDDITGVTYNLFFVDHCKPEFLERGLQSYSNHHEADFLVALCSYLLLQGYERSQITILTMYTGQLLLLQEKMPRRIFGGVRVCAVDNFQGEENDIILLSLVRSNDERRIGFLGESNRICVALSRARQGFYCIGNFSLLKSQSKLWKEICDYLQTNNAIGENLQLICKKHRNVTDVRCSNDFDRSGGCKKPCADRLSCGHACERLCHVADLDHQNSRCSKTCFISCPNGHQCRLVCHYPEECPACYKPVLKTIPQCGHEQSVPCSIDPANFSCQVNCTKILPCGHEKNMPCFKDPTVHSQCDRKCTKVLDCGHPCSKRCTEACQCNTRIEAVLECGHQKWVLCRKKDSVRCTERCERTMDCGHVCPGFCYEDCRMKVCESIVDKLLPCGHKQNVPCHLDPHNAFCHSPCQRQLDCGHRCSTVCGRPCRDSQCEELCLKKCEKDHPCQRRCHFGLSCGDCMVSINATLSACGHNVKIPCHLDPTTLRCERTCERLRVCGHHCQGICSRNCEARPCKELVDRTLPCDHPVTLPCHTNPETYSCKQTVEVHLSCGHQKSMVCHVAKAGIENVLCNEMMDKELHCKHTVKLPCHKNPGEYTCKEKVRVKLTCGHIKSLVCSTVTADLEGVSCMVKMKRRLPCEHEVTLPCYRNPEEYCCQQEIQTTLSCGHKKTIKCSKLRDDIQEVTCDMKVTRKLPCGHEKKMKCSEQPERVLCDAPCERLLPCNHPCPGICGEECASLKCAVAVQKNLACGFHKVTCVCSEDVSQNICQNQCKRNLPCGHKCPGKCNEDCTQRKCRKMIFKRLSCKGNHSSKMACSDDPQMVACGEPCNRNLDCGHPCPGLCSQECKGMKCMRRIEKRFPCSHKEPIYCFESNTVTCTAPCRRKKNSCKHICKGLCGQNCSNYPCGVVVVKTLQCGHKIKMPCGMSADGVQCPAACGETLPCGHQCSGSCDDCHQRGSHELCQQPCGKVLVCSHRCKAVCSLPCPPCDRKCGRRCPHGQCKKRCSQVCLPCNKPCTWICPHYQCDNLCGEECDRPRCDAPCPKRLSCYHPCIGLCGENCPTVCAVCNPNKLSSVLGGPRNKLEVTRCLQLIDCGHIITVEEMDKWMLSDLGSDVQLMRCPKCSTSITFSYRYGNVIKRTLKNVENVKTQIAELENDVTRSVSLIGKDLDHLKHDATQKQRFPQRFPRFEESIPWTWNPFRRTVSRESSALFKFTFKNHLMILQQIDTADQLLQSVCKGPTSCQQQSELKELLNETKDALEKIKEYLEEPVLDLRTLSQVHEQTRKFLLFSYVLEAQSKAAMRGIPFSSIGATRVNSACDRFRLFLQGDDDALDLDWLRKVVNLLRIEVTLPLLPSEEAKEFANFPGYQRGVWKVCSQGHVYFIGSIVRGGEEALVGSDGCTRCTPDEREEWYNV